MSDLGGFCLGDSVTFNEESRETSTCPDTSKKKDTTAEIEKFVIRSEFSRFQHMTYLTDDVGSDLCRNMENAKEVTNLQTTL